MRWYQALTSLLPKTSKTTKPKYKIHIDDPFCWSKLTQQLNIQLKRHNPHGQRPTIVVCIGTDRSTGDSLGPLVGSKLKAFFPKKCHIYGTLEKPIHAANLETTMQTIAAKYPQPFVIAVDASLGRLENVGFVFLGTGPLKPGAGVHKNLPPVGDIHLSGIVNVGGCMEYFVLQNTRLHLVMKMANQIALSLLASAKVLNES